MRLNYLLKLINQTKTNIFLILTLFFNFTQYVYGTAFDCKVEPTGENYIGVRYKAFLAEDKLPETGWVLLFCGNGFTMNGEYQPHFVDLMIKAGWASQYDDGLCANGFPPVKANRKNFTIQFGLSDYEDAVTQDNDIAVWTRNPYIFPRMFTNIDSTSPDVPDKIMCEYQIDKGGYLEGREIEVSFVREEITMLPQNENYFMDPDCNCRQNSQANILFRHWVATLKVPSLELESSVDFYINASQGDKIRGDEALNILWENPGKTSILNDKYKVIIYNPEVQIISGEWKEVKKFLVDLRTPDADLPLNNQGQLVGGYRKVNYKGHPAIEASFGYGYLDYVKDGNPNEYELSDSTKAVIDLRYLAANHAPELSMIGSKIVGEGQELKFIISAKDIDYDTLTYSASNLPPGASINDSTQTFSWTPKFNQSGIYESIHFQVSDGSFTDSEDITITVRSKIAVNDVSLTFFVYPPYPNPFNPIITFIVSVPQESQLDLSIYNITGQRVAKIADNKVKAGLYTFLWNAKGKPSGIYFCKARVENASDIKKILLLK
jgi:hypothetical protein